jgi:hypothetical protein
VKKILEIRNFLATRFVRLVLAGLTRVTIRDGSENKGAELVRGGEGQIRGAKG